MSGCGGGGSQFDQRIVWDNVHTPQTTLLLGISHVLTCNMPITSTHAQKKFKKEEKANPHKINSALSKFLSNSFPICPVDCIMFKSSLYAYCE